MDRGPGGERLAERLRRFYETLSATGQAIARQASPQALYEAVCRACEDTGLAQRAHIDLRQGGGGAALLPAPAGRRARLKHARQHPVRRQRQPAHVHQQRRGAGGREHPEHPHADAAAALLACSALWETGHTRAELAELAAPLGADVPFSVLGGAAVGLGTGAELTPVAARTPVHLVLVPADAGLSTPVVFQTLDELRREGHLPDGPARPEVNEAVLRALTAADPLELATAMDNDLQTPAVVLFPELSDVLDLGMDEGALRGMVSGSGPTLLFVAQDEASALRLASAIEERTGVRALPVHGPVPGAHVL